MASTKGSMTRSLAEALQAQGRAVWIMPRKKLVRIDGHQLYRLVDGRKVS